jgi:hypothetical protein
MKRLSALLVLVGLLIPILTTNYSVTAFSPQLASDATRDRFRSNLIEPDGFLSIKLGNSFRYAEDLFGEPQVVRTGSIEWRFTSADFDPYEGLTVLGDKKKINGFVAYLRPGRIQFKDMNLIPKEDKFGAFSATRSYVTGKFRVTLLVQGQDSNYVRRVILQAKEE